VSSIDPRTAPGFPCRRPAARRGGAMMIGVGDGGPRDRVTV
jgi:hypothetical protein